MIKMFLFLWTAYVTWRIWNSRWWNEASITEAQSQELYEDTCNNVFYTCRHNSVFVYWDFMLTKRKMLKHISFIMCAVQLPSTLHELISKPWVHTFKQTLVPYHKPHIDHIVVNGYSTLMHTSLPTLLN